MNITIRPDFASRWSLKRVLKTAHLWVGLMLGLPLVQLGLTGSILVFEDELHGVLDPPRQSAAGEPHGFDDVLAVAQQAAPSGSKPALVSAPDRPRGLASVQFTAPRGSSRPALEIQVDPVSLETFSVNPSNGEWLRWIQMFHAQLIPGSDARAVVGWLGVAMVGLGCSGIVLWWPRRDRWKAAFTVDRAARGFRLYREIHGMVGIWCWLVFMTVGASSLYLTFPETVGGAIRGVFHARDFSARTVPHVVPVSDGSPITLDRAAALARAEIGEATPRFIGLPQRPDQPMRIDMVRSGSDRGAPMISVFVDPWTGRVVEVRDPRRYSFGESLIAWQHAIHSGDGLGWLWRLFVFVSGLLPAVFMITGAAMWFKQRR